MTPLDSQSPPSLRRLRRLAVTASLFRPTSLDAAIEALEFVQYDPLRHPACAQDLILRQRVRGYRCGDLWRHYVRLGLEEDFLHVYGAMTRRLHALVHPRPDASGTAYRPEGLAAEVLDLVRASGPMAPRDVAARFERQQAVNAWGGFSAASTLALEDLHYYGLLRIAGRQGQTKLYVAAPPRDAGDADPEARLAALTLHLARAMAPIPESSLNALLAQLQRAAALDGNRRDTVTALVARGELEAETIEGVRYLWPAGLLDAGDEAVGERVRFLAPFDPVVWDRKRFEHLMGWAYRFEAYTPAAKRKLGYYALPMLQGERAVGWVNCRMVEGRLAVEPHFAGRALTGAGFRRAFDREVAALEASLSGTE